MRDRNWRRFFGKLLLATVIAALVVAVPLPVWTPDWFVYWQIPAVIFLLICYVGKLLIDTILFPPKK